jgi:hypothetical protein
VASAETGGIPANPEKWGWQRDDYQWQARGLCIGWLTNDGALYLEPDIAYTLASRIGSIGVSAETLSAYLADKGVTVPEREGNRMRYRPKREVKGVRQRVLHIRSLEWLHPPPSNSGANGAGKDGVAPLAPLAPHPQP